MSCKYCDLKRRKDEDDDAEWIAGEDWESESDDGGYICPHGDGFRMLVYYDAKCACTVVDNIKYCPFCGEELKAPKEPLIKDEKVRKAVRAWAEANTIRSCICKDEMHCITFETERGMFISFEYAIPIPPEGNFTIDELCGEEGE